MSLERHVVRCFVGGLVAILPIGGTILAVVYAENMVRTSLLANNERYFVVPRSGVKAVDMRVHEALKVLVAVGKTDVRLQGRAT